MQVYSAAIDSLVCVRIINNHDQDNNNDQQETDDDKVGICKGQHLSKCLLLFLIPRAPALKQGKAGISQPDYFVAENLVLWARSESIGSAF